MRKSVMDHGDLTNSGCGERKSPEEASQNA